MKKAEDIASEAFASAANCRHASTRLKRLATALRNEASSSSHGLSEKERDALVKAVAIIGQLSVAQKSAEAILRKRDARRAQIDAQAKALIRQTFAGLNQIEDQVALVGAVNISDLRLGFVRDRRDLERCFKEALDSICSRVTVSVEKGGRLEVILDELWRSFQEKKPDLVLKFSDDIKNLQRTP